MIYSFLSFFLLSLLTTRSFIIVLLWWKTIRIDMSKVNWRLRLSSFLSLSWISLRLNCRSRLSWAGVCFTFWSSSVHSLVLYFTKLFSYNFICNFNFDCRVFFAFFIIILLRLNTSFHFFFLFRLIFLPLSLLQCFYDSIGVSFLLSFFEPSLLVDIKLTPCLRPYIV